MSYIRAWFLATRPKTLTAACFPLVVGLSFAARFVAIDIPLAVATFLTAICIQIGTNLINDALDFRKGADTEHRLGPMRVTQNGLLSFRMVYSVGVCCFAAALLFGVPLILRGGGNVALFLLLSVISGYCYTGGPYPLAYHGLSELFVLLFFGFGATVVTAYVQMLSFDPYLLLFGAQMGLLATALLAINNLRDREQDAQVDKQTLAVRLGVTLSKVEITVCVLLPFVLQIGAFAVTHLWWLPLLVLPQATFIVRAIWLTVPGRIYNAFLGKTAFLHLTFGILLSLSLVLGG